MLIEFDVFVIGIVKKWIIVYVYIYIYLLHFICDNFDYQV